MLQYQYTKRKLQRKWNQIFKFRTLFVESWYSVTPIADDGTDQMCGHVVSSEVHIFRFFFARQSAVDTQQAHVIDASLASGK